MTIGRNRHTPEQVVRKLGQADRMLGDGADVAAVCRELGLSEQTYYRWRNQYGGLKADDAKRRSRKRVGSSTVDASAAVAPNLVWAVDFQFDADEQGRPIKICSIVDEHTRECSGGLTERSITADRLTTHLEELVAVRGAPAVLRPDNGPEFISDAMADWAGTRTGLFYIPPGSPWHNG